jgi:hypothetical protein
MSFNYTNVKLTNLVIHNVGTKMNNEPLIISDKTATEYAKESEYLLVNYFFSAFKQPEYYSFWHESQLSLNACNVFSKEIFNNENTFLGNTKKIAQHLYECSMHPNIKNGELYIAFFENCIIDEEVVSAIVIIKAEAKNNFIQTYKSQSHLEIKINEGFSLDKVDKGCIIFNTNKENGYKVKIVNNQSKGYEPRYWKDDFLKVIELADEYFNTKHFLEVAQSYVANKYSNDFDVSKTEKIDLLNRSIDYFRKNEYFDKNDFENEVFFHQEVIDSFRKFDGDFQKQNSLNLEANFSISNQAVKKQERIFKSVLKLDKNFHIYIHGDKELIQSGVDKDGRKYYKIYYENEE